MKFTELIERELQDIPEETAAMVRAELGKLGLNDRELESFTLGEVTMVASVLNIPTEDCARPFFEELQAERMKGGPTR